MGFKLWGKDAPRRFFGEKHLNEPLKWDTEAFAKDTKYRVFVNSMSDLFEDRRDLDEHRENFWKFIPKTPNLIYLLLTKRADKIMSMVPEAWKAGFPGNVYIGVTSENQRRLDERMEHLANTNARRWVSYEPGLEAVDLSKWKNYIDWFIIGGESGKDARPMDLEWARSAVRQCRDYGIVPFVKQLGGHPDAQKDISKWPVDLQIQEFLDG